MVWFDRNVRRGRPPQIPQETTYSFGARGGALRRPVPLGGFAEAPVAAPAPLAAVDPQAETRAGSHSPPEAPARPSTDISGAFGIAGFIGACLVDSDSGLMIASEGGGQLDLETAAAHSAQVVKAKLQAIETLGLDDRIEDILITMGRQLHMIRPLERAPSLFLYVALDKKAANLGMARMQVKRIEGTLSL